MRVVSSREWDRPAVLGGTPILEQFTPIVRPALPRLDEELTRDVAQLLASGMLTKGRWLVELEARVAELVGARHAVALSSGTMGLLLTYHGLGLTGEVIVPSFTFMATVHPLPWLGIEPVFVDIDPHTWNVDPDQVEALITPRTSAVVAVHNFGNPAPVAELEAMARSHGLKLVFDAAHGFGSWYRGRAVGCFGDAEVFSLTPTKLVVAGEGGIVTTNNDALAAHLRAAREYGNAGGAADAGSEFPGLNGRMPEFNALLAVRTLERLQDATSHRNHLVAMFRERLERIPGLRFQTVHPQDRCSYKELSITVDVETFGLDRDVLARALRAENIDTRKYHYPAVHEQGAYRLIAPRYRGRLPVTERVAANSLSLPLWSQMDEELATGICAAIARIHAYCDQVRVTLAGCSAVLASAGDQLHSG